MADLKRMLGSFGLAMEAQNLAPKTRAHYLYDLGGFVSWLTGQGLNDWGELTGDHVRGYIIHFRETGGRDGKGRAPKTVREATLSIKKLTAWMAEEGEIPTDIAANIKLPAAPWTEQPSYSEEEIQKLLSACSPYSREGIRDKAMLSLLVDSGLRAGELVNMSELNLKEGTVKVEGKGGERTAPMQMATAQAIDKMLRRWGIDEDSPPYFRSLKGGAGLSESGCYQVLKRLCALTGVPMKGLHAMRRTAIISAKADGIQDSDLMTAVGHKSPVMIMRYTGATASKLAKTAWQSRGNNGS